MMNDQSVARRTSGVMWDEKSKIWRCGETNFPPARTRLPEPPNANNIARQIGVLRMREKVFEKLNSY
jgi:hypothetical protein